MSRWPGTRIVMLFAAMLIALTTIGVGGIASSGSAAGASQPSKSTIKIGFAVGLTGTEAGLMAPTADVARALAIIGERQRRYRGSPRKDLYSELPRRAVDDAGYRGDLREHGPRCRGHDRR